MKKSTRIFLSAIIAVLALPTISCQNEALDDDLQREMYVREFIKQFGLVDHGHTWSMAEASSLTIEAGTGIKSAKIYAHGDKEYRIVASYTNLTGTNNLEFDIPKGCTDLLVDINGRRFHAAPGQKVSATGVISRADNEVDLSATVFGSGGQTSTIVCGDITLSAADHFKVFCTDMLYPVNARKDYSWTVDKHGHQYTGTGGIVSEDSENTPDKNIPGVHYDFMYESDGTPIYLYPVFWDKTIDHNFGIFYVDENGNHVDEALFYIDASQQSNNSMFRVQMTDREGSVIQNELGLYKYDEYSIMQWLNALPLRDAASNPINVTSLKQVLVTDDSDNYVHDGVKLIFKPEYLTQINNYLRSQYTYTYCPQGSFLRANQSSSIAKIDPATGLPYASEGHECELPTVSISDVSGGICMCAEIPLWYPSTMHAPVLTTDEEYSYDQFGRVNLQDVTASTMPYDLIPGESHTIATRAIQIDAPAGTKFGFYILYDGKYAYSNTAIQFGEETGHQVELNNGNSWSCTFKEPIWGNTYLAFDDAFSSGGIKDYNDIIFMIDGGVKRAVDPQSGTTLIAIADDAPGPGSNDPTPGENEDPVIDEPFEWIYAAEDMGSVGDWDFNDVVFAITYVAGNDDSNDKIKIYPLAAGGTLTTHLFFGWLNDKDHATQVMSEEWHRLFGASTHTTMINTYSSNNLRFSNAYYTVDKPSGWTISSDQNFMIRITDKDELGEPTYRWITRNSKEDREGHINVPQMLILPDGWKWPVEYTNINNAYSGFRSWTGSQDQIGWASNPTAGAVINWSKSGLPTVEGW